MFGASSDTGNLGVSALWHAASSGLAERLAGLELTVFDVRRGRGKAQLRLADREVAYQRIGANHSRRYYRSDSLWNMRLASRTGGKWNAGIEALRAADAVVDVSGGDSFADLYGQARFDAITQHKLFAFECDKPLILLPQTYGPFNQPENRKLAESIVRRASMAWARDPRSFAALQDLLGDAFDPERHRSGVDMAFGLMRYQPREPVGAPVGEWLQRRDGEILVGVNVSGLLYGHYDENVKTFGFRAEYSSVIHELVRRLLVDERVRVVLLPHVYGAGESDSQACLTVQKALQGHGDGRLTVLPGAFDQSEIKWVISQLDWFCGTRMHSAIAGLSSGVPTSAIAYSLKTQGVFETCDQGGHVADPRELDTIEVVDALLASFADRDAARESLEARLPTVRSMVATQMDAIADRVRAAVRSRDVQRV